MKTIVKRVYILDGGCLELESSTLVAGKNYGRRIRVPVQMFLVETADGYVLVDTGNDPDVIADAPGTWGAELVRNVTPRMAPENHPYAQLELLGLTARDIRTVVYTHLHHDHAGGARFFPDALHIVQKAEYRWAFNPDRFAEMIYLKSDFGHTLQWQLADGDWCFSPGLHLLSTPGHTPGHQSVVLWDVPDIGTVIIAGDAVYCRENVERDVPPGIATSVPEASASLHRITALASATDATLLVSHEAEWFGLLPKAPEPLGPMNEDVRRFYDRGVAHVYGDTLEPAGQRLPS